MKILYGTGNPAKLEAMRRRLANLNIELIGLRELEAEGYVIPDVQETGNTPLENARQKAMAYYEAFKMPVFSCDSGLYFDNVPDEVQPGVHVRNVKGKCLSDEEMMEYYGGLVKKYGNLTARYKNAICFVMNENKIYEAMEPSMESEKFILTDIPHSTVRKKGFPLDSMSIDRKTNRYYYDLPAEKLEQVAVEDGFLMFFQKILNFDYVKNLNRIEFVVTLACTGRCRHCSEGDHTSCSEHIDAGAAINAIREVYRRYKIESLMTFGGEPLLYPEVVSEIHRAAKELGIPRRDLITNGFFTKDKGRIKEVADMLADSGVCKILLSVDAFHQETIPLEPVLYFAECIAAAGIPIKLSPAWLVSEEDDNPYNRKTREILGEFVKLKIPVGSGNVIVPRGNALKYLSEYFDENREYSSPYDEDPSDIRAICFSPNGDVLNGNIYQKSILDILDTYHP